MELHPILSAMRRNKVGAIVIVAQTAITLAILCNSLFLIQQRLRSSERPTGLQEQDIFTMANQWVGNPAGLAAKTQADLAALRALPEVVDAFVSNSYPLSNGGWDDGLSYEAGDPHWVTSGALYLPTNTAYRPWVSSSSPDGTSIPRKLSSATTWRATLRRR